MLFAQQQDIPELILPVQVPDIRLLGQQERCPLLEVLQPIVVQ